MKEIKEILEYFRKYMTIDDCVRLNKIEDYITNLQEQLHQASLDIQELTERDIDCPSWCDKLTNLQEENKRLLKIKKYAEDVGNKRNELYERIDKAVEYIKENEFYLDYKTGACIKGVIPLLNILQGEDSE